ncbi:MerR family transcriptional regulator [Bifidobacterium aemilianum]|uniref:MerR family transcriptional regulator n=1 Tax=Bifidobacterium aemilianum TaxID=2493120 RepID=A0A366K6Y1_9BIFI|nr:MerR family transcriptional regulator [Bifidobacterium aemilianum]RBP97439.1 MerR family transcriptional regulator [Bifidobacterium aemilianum]
MPISTLRYYERRCILKPKHSPEGYRDYGDGDVAWISFMHRIPQVVMPLAQVDEYSRLREEGDGTMRQRLEMLEEQRGLLEGRQHMLAEQQAFLDTKIAIYRKSMRAAAEH